MRNFSSRVLAFRPAVLLAALAATVLAGLLSACSRGCGDSKVRPNIIIVIVDTLPAGHVSSYGYPRSTTSNMDRVAEDGIRFEHAVAPSPWTLPSIASILTGALPSRHLAGWHLDPPTMEDRRLSRMRPEITTLAQMCRNRGYNTVGFFNNPFVHPGYGLDKGFDTYDYVGGDNLELRSAGQVTQDVIRWLELHGDDPFFMTVHYFDPHLAYDPPLDFAAPYIHFYQGELTRPFDPELAAIRSGKMNLDLDDRKFIVGLYDAEVAFTDSQLGVLLDYLESRELYNRTLLILTADHGEEFWEHEGFEHGHTLHREVIEVPLIIKYPDLSFAGKTVHEYVSLTDIFPTIAEFMEWPLSFSIDGVSIYPRGGRLKVIPHTVVSENLHYGTQRQAFYSEGLKLIVNRDTGRIRLYDLSRDPEERNNVFGELELPESVKAQVEHIARDLEEHIKKAGTPAILDKETVEKLKSLGYLSY